MLQMNSEGFRAHLHSHLVPGSTLTGNKRQFPSNLELTDSARLAGQQVPEPLLSPAPQHLDYKHTQRVLMLPQSTLY